MLSQEQGTVTAVEPLMDATEAESERDYVSLLARYEQAAERNQELSLKLERVQRQVRCLVMEKSLLLDRLHDEGILHPHHGLHDTQQRLNPENRLRTRSDQGSRLSPPSLVQSLPHTPLPCLKRSVPPQWSPPSKTLHKLVHDQGLTVLSSRPKRMRRPTLTCPKVRRVQPLERDPITGFYQLPVRIGILTVHSLGEIMPWPTYHNDRYIWPAGFKTSRTYLSMVNPDANTVYTCTVEKNGQQGPRFRVVADDCADQPVVANSATGVWTDIVKRANEIRNKEHSNSASGPDYYGFTHATIAKMIQDLPGADQCHNYIWQHFEVMQKRTAAGVAAAALKKLTNLEIMGSANKKPPVTQSLTSPPSVGHNAQNLQRTQNLQLPDPVSIRLSSANSTSSFWT